MDCDAQYDDETRIYAQQQQEKFRFLQQRQQQQQQQQQKNDQRGDSNSPATLSSHGSESKRDRASPCASSRNGLNAAEWPGPYKNSNSKGSKGNRHTGQQQMSHRLAQHMAAAEQQDWGDK